MEREVYVNFENGYVFNDASGKLEYFQFEKAEFSFQDCKVKYYGKLGGKEVVLDKLEMYKTEEMFREGRVYKDAELKITEFNIESRGLVWVFRGGKAIRIPDDEKYIAVSRWEFYLASGEKAYKSAEDVYDNNNYIVKDSDGTERIVECAASKCKLTEIQELYLAQLAALIEGMEKENLGFIYDERDCKVKVINQTRIERIEMDCDRYDACDGWTDIKDMYVPTKIRCYYTHDDEYVNAKFKD